MLLEEEVEGGTRFLCPEVRDPRNELAARLKMSSTLFLPPLALVLVHGFCSFFVRVFFVGDFVHFVRFVCDFVHSCLQFSLFLLYDFFQVCLFVFSCAHRFILPGTRCIVLFSLRSVPSPWRRGRGGRGKG